MLYHTDCPSCYSVIPVHYNATTDALLSLVEATNNSSSAQAIHPPLTAAVTSLYSSLLSLSAVLRNTTLRHDSLLTNLLGTNEGLTGLDLFSDYIQQLEASVNSIRERRLLNEAKRNNITEQVRLVEQLLKDNVTDEVQKAVTLMLRIDSIITNISSAIRIAEITAANQSTIVRGLVDAGLRLTDNTSELLQSISELLVIENSTLELLIGLSECGNLNTLLADGRDGLSNAKNRTTAVLREAMQTLDGVWGIEFNERGEQLIELSLELLTDVNETYTHATQVSQRSRKLIKSFNGLNAAGNQLIARATNINNTVQELLKREEVSLFTARLSVREGEEIINKVEDILSRLEDELERIISFVERLDGLKELVEEVEKESNTSLSITIQTGRRINELINTIETAGNIIMDTINALDHIHNVRLTLSIGIINISFLSTLDIKYNE